MGAHMWFALHKPWSQTYMHVINSSSDNKMGAIAPFAPLGLHDAIMKRYNSILRFQLGNRILVQ